MAMVVMVEEEEGEGEVVEVSDFMIVCTALPL